MKKFIPLVIVGMLVLCGLEAVAMPFNIAETSIQKWKETPQKTLCNVDELDQSQELYNWFGPVGSGPMWSFSNYIMAQSFTPTKNLLTRIELYIGKNSTTTFDYTVAIRDDLNGSDLASVNLSAAEITTENFSWEEFDIPDLMVTPGDTYYIVSSTANVTDNWYYWGLYMNGTVYPNGTIYYTYNDEVTWDEEPGGDMSFKTYGTDATALGVEITGGIGVTVNTKNVGEINAQNAETWIEINGGILGLINISGGLLNETLAPGDLFPFKILPLGLGPITIVVTARADNAVEVTKTVDGLILFFLVIMK